jgi:hypothetical protein
MLRVLLGGNVSRYTDALRRDPQMLLGHCSYLVNAVLQGTRSRAAAGSVGHRARPRRLCACPPGLHPRPGVHPAAEGRVGQHDPCRSGCRPDHGAADPGGGRGGRRAGSRFPRYRR